MMQLRWVFHDLKAGGPPTGSIYVGERLYQKLQYRQLYTPQFSPQLPTGSYSTLEPDTAPKQVWSEWADVPHAGMPDTE